MTPGRRLPCVAVRARALLIPGDFLPSVPVVVVLASLPAPDWEGH